jgi:hypothetical protein
VVVQERAQARPAPGPDIILVGELRDLETIELALTAAETGTSSWPTLHTQDAAQTIDRVIDVFPPSQQQQVRVQLAGALQGVSASSWSRRRRPRSRRRGRGHDRRRPAVRNLIREGKTHQVYSGAAGRLLARHADRWTATWPPWSDRAASRTTRHSRSAITTEDFNRLAAGAESDRMDDVDVRLQGPDGSARSSPAPSTAETTAQVAAKLRTHGLRADQHRRGQGPAACSARSPSRVRVEEGGPQGPRGLLPPVRHDDQLGLSLLRALSILTDQTENKELARVLGEVRNDIETGSSLSVAMAKHVQVFPPLMVNMCRAGEVGGFLDMVLLQIADNYEAEVKLRGKVKAR